MPEIGSFVGFKITEFFQELWYLNDYSENIFIWWVIVHWESLNGLVVLNDRVESFLLKFLPIPTQFILIVLVKQEKKVLYIWNNLLQFKIALWNEQMVSLLFQLSNWIGSVFQRLCNFLMVLAQISILPLFFFFYQYFNKALRFNRVDVFILHYKVFEHIRKQRPLLLSKLCQIQYLLDRQTFLT